MWWLAAVFVTVVGRGMLSLANAYIIYDRTHSVGITGLLAVVQSVPPLVLPAAATALAQRFGGPRTYIARFLASAIVGFAPVALSATGHLTAVALLAWCAAMSAIEGLTSPSGSLVQRMLAPPAQLPEFNAAAARNCALAWLIGLVAGAAVFATVGATWVYAINAVSYLPMIVPAIALLGHDAPAASNRQRFRSVLGLLYGPDARLDLRAAARFTALNLAIGGYTVTLPAIAHGVGTGATSLSLLKTAAAVGGVATAAAMRRLHRRVGWGRVQRGCFCVAGLGVGLLAWATHPGAGAALTLVLGIAAILPVGFALSLDQAILTALVQMWTPEQSRAVFFTYYALIPTVAVPVGQEAIGLLADRVSVSVALSLVAVVTLVLVAIGPRLPMRAAFDAMSRAEEPPLPHR
jgi:MFS family permease